MPNEFNIKNGFISNAYSLVKGVLNISGNTTSTGEIRGLILRSTQSSGDEGGQLDLSTPQTNSTISGGTVSIDIYQNKIRFFESGGSNRGAYIDLTTASVGVGSNLLSGGGGETNTASNLGSGTGLFAQKSGVDLQFKSLTSTGGTINISNNATTVNIEATSTGGGGTFTGGTVPGPTIFRGGLSAFTNSTTWISGATSTDLVRITQSGSGNAFVVEDDVNPDSTPFVISNTGSVGIGTTTPSAKLHVQDLSTLGTSGGSYYLVSTIEGRVGGTNDLFHDEYRYRDTSGSTWFTSRLHDSISIDLSYKTPGVDTRVWWERDPWDNIQSWGDGANTYMTINNSDIGIGITTPSAKLHVNNTDSGDSFLVEDETNPDATPFVINNVGNVGIGTSAYTSSIKLVVNGNTLLNNGYLLWSYDGASNNDYIIHRDNAHDGSGNISGFYLFKSDRTLSQLSGTGNSTLDAGSIWLNTSTEKNYIAGDTGIGTTTPTAKLHVNNTTTGTTVLFEDSTNPDFTPFIIDSVGRVGIGTQTPVNWLTIESDSENNDTGANINLINTGVLNFGTEKIGLGISVAGASSNFAIQLQDGTEGFGKFLYSATADGKALWTNNLSGQSFTITTTPTNSNDSTQILTRNSTTGRVEYVDGNGPVGAYNYGMAYTMLTGNYMI